MTLVAALVRRFIGGDECHTTCWAQNPDIVAWATSMNLTCTAAVESVGGEVQQALLILMLAYSVKLYHTDLLVTVRALSSAGT